MDRTAHFYAHPTYAQRGSGLPIYSGSRRQRGGGVLGAIKSFFMPILGNLAKRGTVNALGLAEDVAMDAFSGKNVKESLKTHGVNRAKRVGMSVLQDTIGQIGRKQKPAPPRRSSAPSRKRAMPAKAKQNAKRAKKNF